MAWILLAIILKGMLTQTFKGHAAQKTGRDDPVCVDVVEQKGNPCGFDSFDFVDRHDKHAM
jgi:hypothetical protein